jgi:hypothetical protein
MTANQLSIESVVRRCDGFVTAEIDDEVAMLNIEKGTCYGLNKVGSKIWEMLEAPRRVSDICEILLQKFEVERSLCERQVLDLLEELRAEGMVETK